ncbi:hypothetical protein MXD81_35600 [Microbacteriaceae bacterium K1510]|nr:hypothetical protein [Microbacteriaceae bacterium K1510]
MAQNAEQQMRGSTGLSRRIFIGAAAATLMLTGIARADEGPVADGDAAVGVGMICNTSQQAERFVALRAEGSEPDKAMAAVNKEARDPHACGLAAIAFKRDATLDSKPIADKLVQVVRINVVAGFNGNGWQPVSGLVQYAVMEGEGETI